MLMLNRGSDAHGNAGGGSGGNTVFNLDLETGKIVDEFKLSINDCDVDIESITEAFKNSEIGSGAGASGDASNPVLFKGVAGNRVFTVDPRAQVRVREFMCLV
jgi:hypothetical protein